MIFTSILLTYVTNIITLSYSSNYPNVINFYSLHSSNEFNLDYACARGHLDIVKYFVSLGVNIRANKDAFRLACQYGHLDIVKYFVSLCVNIHTNMDYALHLACKYGHLNVVKYLIDLGANIHADNDWIFRYSPLHILKYINSLSLSI